MSLPNINFLHLTVSEIQPGQTFSRRPPIRTPWVKTIPQQPLSKKCMCGGGIVQLNNCVLIQNSLKAALNTVFQSNSCDGQLTNLQI